MMAPNPRTLRGDHGAALPLVILMTVLLALTLSATAVLTQSAANTVRSQSMESSKRAALVTTAMQQALRDLTPRTGRLLGVDPRVDPAGSCVGQLGPYTTAIGSTVSVDCVQATDSGRGSAMSSLLLVGDGSDCGSSCTTGQDGGLLVNSNSALAFQGILINVAGAWDVKKVALNPDASATTSLLQPTPDTACPAASNSFVSNPNCDCPSGMDATRCFQRQFSLLRADVNGYTRMIGAQIAASVPSTTATVPTCTDRAVLPGTNLWALRMSGGTVGVTQLAAINQLFSGVTCIVDAKKNQTETVRIGDGSTQQTPMLIINGVLRFQDIAGTAMAPGSASTSANTWTINNESAVVVLGTPLLDATNTAVLDCATTQPGGMLQFTGSTYLRLDAGRLFLCPSVANGSVLAAPTASAAAGFAWQGLRTQPLLATTFGRSGGEVLKAHGMVFAPATFFDINSQDKETQVRLDGGTILRALTMTANQSTGALAKGSFAAPMPIASGAREVQLRFWDVTRGRDLGIVQLVISDSYPTNPGLGYAFKVWRTMW